MLVNKSKLFGVTREHDLVDIHFEKLFLLGLALSIEQDVVDGSLQAANDRFGAIFIHEHGLVVHNDLLLQFQVSLAEDKDLSLTSYINFSLRANR